MEYRAGGKRVVKVSVQLARHTLWAFIPQERKMERPRGSESFERWLQGNPSAVNDESVQQTFV